MTGNGGDAAQTQKGTFVATWLNSTAETRSSLVDVCFVGKSGLRGTASPNVADHGPPASFVSAVGFIVFSLFLVHRRSTLPGEKASS